WQRQMMCANKQIARGKGHVLRNLALHSKVSLIRIGVFEILPNWKSERKQSSESREGLIVEALPAKLVLSAGSSARSTVNAWPGARKITNNHASLKHLNSIQKLS